METRIFLLDKAFFEAIAVVTADENNEPVVPLGRNIAKKYCLAAL